ncbi:MAG: undecaprenyl-diphosphate phosphatase [Tissierellales bacterium]|nr:undecaprenyl-diphosphate phosphatase [Tissierellales bacterium]
MEWIELIKVIILGIVEGITEWLPISSTGHMILVNEFMHMNITDEFREMFFVVIQLGAILAVVVLYFGKLFPFSFKKEEQFIKKETMNLWFKIVVACLPAAVIGLAFDDILDELFYNYQTVSIMLIFYGIVFIWLEKRNKDITPRVDNLNEISYKLALAIGVFQLLALIPGTSRSGATIIGAMLLGSSRVIAAEFTFFLAIPVMFGASLVKLIKFGLIFTTNEIIILVLGMIVAFIVSILAIKFLMGYIKKHDFKVFGWYRIVLGVIVLGYFLLN